MSPALNGSLTIRRFEGSDAIEIHDRITFDFYTGLPHMLVSINKVKITLPVNYSTINSSEILPYVITIDREIWLVWKF